MRLSHCVRFAQGVSDRFGPPLIREQLSTRLIAEAKKTSAAYERVRKKEGKTNIQDLLSFFQPPTVLLDTPKNGEEKKIRELWADYNKVKRPVKEVVQQALNLVENDFSSHQKVAVDLGCGNSELVVELLRKGWKGHAVDSSPESLFRLCETIVKEKLANGNDFELCLEEMEKFTLTEKVHLIVAQNALSYSKASCFLQLWDNMEAFLRPGGYLVGNMFVQPLDLEDEEVQREHRIWFADMQMVKELAENKDYQIIRLDQERGNHPSINFIFRKK